MATGFALACGSTSSSAGQGDAGTGDDAGDDANAIPDWCPMTSPGISKGPWSLAVNETSAKVRWEACHPGTSGDLFFSPEAGGAEQKVSSVETPITITNTYRAPLNGSAPPDYAGVYYTHEAAITGLTASTCYSYRIAALDGTKGRFCTARNAGDPIRFMVIGDTNPTLGDSTKNVLAHSLPKNPDFILHGGDIQYYDSTLETWAAWFPIMNPMLLQGAFFPAIGNHEDEKQNPGELATYSLRFFGGAGFDGTDTYYRVESGGVWFFSVDTELPIDPASEQAQWLVQSLADASSKPGYRFSIVFMHRPLLTCGDTGDNPIAQQYFETIFKQHNVPLVLQAHMHGYERFEYNGITYVTAAGGGGAIGNVNGNITRSYCNTRVASGGFYHAVTVDVTTGMLSAVVIDDMGTTRDTFAHAVP
ncbi:MAG: metallophosphoesterase [Polyangiales bacterium]